MFALATIPLQHPITLQLPVRPPLRARIQSPPQDDGPTADYIVDVLHVCFRINPTTRAIHAEIPPVPDPILLYGPDEFSIVAADTPEQHADRVLQILGSDPAAVLQAYADGVPPELPARVPREIPNWRVKAVLHQMGLLDRVEQSISAVPEPSGTIIRLAWSGDAKFARHSQTVLTLATSLGLSPDQVDEIFIRAEAIPI